MEKLTHEQIMKTNFVTNDGHVFAVNEDGSQGTLVFTKESVHPAFFNLLRAALLLYQTSQHTSVAIDEMTKIAEDAGADCIVSPLLNIVSTQAVIRDVALNGIESVMARVMKNIGTTH